MTRGVGLDVIIGRARARGSIDAPRTLHWRRSLLVELCRVVAGAHAQGLAHTNLTTGTIVVDGAGHVRVDGWLVARSSAAVDADIEALGAIANELLTLEVAPQSVRGDVPPSAGSMPSARVLQRPLLVETGWFLGLACAVVAIAMFGPRWTTMALCVLLLVPAIRKVRAR